MEDRYLYSVFPKMLIRDLPGVGAFRTQKSLSLNKDEVKYCMKFGSVYRRFANENKTERVTMSNIDRLHNAIYMTEDEYKQYLKANIDSNRGQGTIEVNIDVTQTSEAATEDATGSVAVAEETGSEVDEKEAVTENSEKAIAEQTSETTTEDTTGSVAVAEETSKDKETKDESKKETVNTKSVYHGKNKNNKK